ncbi:MAG: bifunctional ornithine acetyltransferase/N-acetylglutamate synthase [Vicinamibacteria bacterium]
MTTDTRPKEVSVDVTIGGVPCVVGGMAKGAGMIAPNMATMLAFFDRRRGRAGPPRKALVAAVGASLNRITVDGDTSTNDRAVALASGAREGPSSTARGRRTKRSPPRSPRRRDGSR